MTTFQIFMHYHILPCFILAILYIVYRIDKMYKKPLTDNNKGYNLLKGGVYEKR